MPAAEAAVQAIADTNGQTWSYGSVCLILGKSYCLDQRGPHSSEGMNFDLDFSIILWIKEVTSDECCPL